MPDAVMSTTQSLITKARRLRADLAAVIEDARAQVWRSRELLLARYPQIRPIGGGSDDARNGAEKTRSLTRDTIVRFLEEQRGEVFCADCITRRLCPGKNIDVAMRHLEGNGLRRRHGQCSACGKSRLVSGL